MACKTMQDQATWKAGPKVATDLCLKKTSFSGKEGGAAWVYFKNILVAMSQQKDWSG